jgi:hypothetical protein
VLRTSRVRNWSIPKSCDAQARVRVIMKKAQKKERRKERQTAVEGASASADALSDGRSAASFRALLLGPPLHSRCSSEMQQAAETLRLNVQGVRELLRSTYGDDKEPNHVMELFEDGLAGGNDFEQAMCQRSLLLFACLRESSVASHYCSRADSEAYTRDVAERVLPFIAPRFLANNCQTPDAFVLLSLVLAEMWPGERLGNWPLLRPGDAPLCDPAG